MTISRSPVQLDAEQLRALGARMIQLNTTKPIGTDGESEFRTGNGRAYELYGPKTDTPDVWSLREDDLLFVWPRTELDNGKEYHVGSWYRRGMEVAAGTYEARVQKKAPAAQAAKRSKPVDALARFHVFAARPDYFAPGPATANPSLGPITGFVPGTAAPRGAAELIGRLEAGGLNLSLTAAGALLVRSAGGHASPDEIAAAAAAERLIVAHLIGEPLPCELDHGKAHPPNAVTVLEIDVAACEQHATGELT